MQVLVASESDIKLKAIRKSFEKKFFGEIKFVAQSVDAVGLPPQPYPSEPRKFHDCAIERAKAVMEIVGDKLSTYSAVVAVENVLFERFAPHRRVVDICTCVVFNVKTGTWSNGVSDIEFDCTLVDCEVKKSGEHANDHDVFGYNKTAGEIIVEHGFAKNPKNWMLEVYRVDRVLQIEGAVRYALY